jgi:hypothetical protein
MEARAAAGVKRQGPPGGCDRRSDNTSVSRDSSMSGKSVFAGVTNKLGPLCVELSHLARDPLTSPWRHERPFFDRRRLPSCFVKPFSKRSRRTQPIKCECSGSWMRSTTLLPAQRSAEVRQCRDDLKTGPLMSDADAEDLIAHHGLGSHRDLAAS